MAATHRGERRILRRGDHRPLPACRSRRSIPLLHLAQEQDGYVTDDAMAHIAELVGVTPAEVLGTCSLLRDVQARAGRARTSSTSAPTSPACSSAARSCCTTPRTALGIKAGGTTADGVFTLEDVECIAACTEAPCLQVNYRYFHKVTPDDARRAGRRPPRTAGAPTRCPPHGTLARVRQQHPADRRAGNAAPGDVRRAGVDRTAATRTSATAARPRSGARLRGRSRDDSDASRSSPPGSSSTTATRSTRYLATGGYEGLQAALAKAPAAVGDEVKAASLLGRGGAGFPAGVKWGFCPPGRVAALPRRQRRRVRAGHLQGPPPHGARSAPAHRGRAHRLLRHRRRAGVPLRPRRDGARPGAHRPGAQRGLRRRLRRPEHPRHRLLRRHRPALGRRRLHRRRGDGAHREPRGQPGHAPPQAAVLPGGQGPLPAAHDRQQRRDAANLPWIVSNGGARVRRARRRDAHRARACSRCRATCSARRVRGRVRRHHLPRPHLRARVRRRHPRRQRAQGVHPRRRVGAVVLRGAPRPAARAGRRRRGRLDARLRAPSS